jgi:hypothetical protein
VHLVTLLEDMPVQETIDAVHELRAADIAVGSIIINDSSPSLVSARTLAAIAHGTLSADDVSRTLKRLALPRPVATARGLLEQAEAYGLRVEGQEERRRALAELGLPVVDLPWIHDGIDLGSLYALAAPLTLHATREGWR